MNAKPGWLRGVIARAETTRTYVFEDGEKTKTEEKNLESLALHCEQAFADLQVQLAVLRDAENHVVECQGAVAKAEISLEGRQAAYLKAAAERAGVPCPK